MIFTTTVEIGMNVFARVPYTCADIKVEICTFKVLILFPEGIVVTGVHYSKPLIWVKLAARLNISDPGRSLNCSS